jgi:hypothetical protein
VRQARPQSRDQFIHFVPLHDQGRQKPQHFFLRAIDQKSRCEEIPRDLFARNFQFGSEHQTLPAYGANHGKFRLKLFQLPAEIFTHFTHVIEHARPLENFHDPEGQAALQRAAAKSRSMHAGRERLRSAFPSDDGGEGQTGRKRLGHDGDIRLEPETLVGEPAARASQPALDLVRDEKGILLAA